jgi:hypothetical protein
VEAKGGPSAIVRVDCTDSDTVCGDRVNCGVDNTDKCIDHNNLTQQMIHENNAVEPPI